MGAAPYFPPSPPPPVQLATRTKGSKWLRTEPREGKGEHSDSSQFDWWHSVCVCETVAIFPLTEERKKTKKKVVGNCEGAAVRAHNLYNAHKILLPSDFSLTHAALLPAGCYVTHLSFSRFGKNCTSHICHTVLAAGLGVRNQLAITIGKTDRKQNEQYAKICAFFFLGGIWRMLKKVLVNW